MPRSDEMWCCGSCDFSGGSRWSVRFLCVMTVVDSFRLDVWKIQAVAAAVAAAGALTWAGQEAPLVRSGRVRPQAKASDQSPSQTRHDSADKGHGSPQIRTRLRQTLP